MEIAWEIIFGDLFLCPKTLDIRFSPMIVIISMMTENMHSIAYESLDKGFFNEHEKDWVLVYCINRK